MTKLTLGEKIRRRRKQLHLTQAALAGEQITRILVSRIESGDINPSLETLRYLADRLDVPPGYLLTEEDDLLQFLLPRIKDTLRVCYKSGDNAGVFALCEEYDLHDDETNMILCECAVRSGRDAYECGDTAAAADWFDRALSYAEETAYHTEVVLGEAVLCKALLAEMTGESPRGYLESYESSLGRAINLERFILLRFFCEMEQGDIAQAKKLNEAMPVLTPLYRQLIAVWMCAAEGDAAGALAMLSAVLRDESAEPLERDPILQYRCIAKMEQLAAAADDYKTAYQYAGKRQQLERRYHIRPKAEAASESDIDHE